MLNWEKQAKEILDVFISGENPAVTIDGKIVSCSSVEECHNCLLFDKSRMCRKKFAEWCQSEYVEPRITIPLDTPVDTKVLVSNDGKYWSKRYLKEVSDGLVFVWGDGRNSWSRRDENDFSHWEYGKLAEE